MPISTQFSDAIHIMSFIKIYQGKIKLTSTNIARSVEISAVKVRQIMSKLSKAGLLLTKHGAANPQPAKPLADITLLDVYLAVCGNKPLFTIDYETNPACIVGGNIQSTLDYYFTEAETAAKAKLDQISLADVVNTILVKQKEKELVN